jgi:Na+/melibiose symporter-like transporter
MLAAIAALLFAIAFIIHAAGIATDAVFAPFSLMLAGLALLAFLSPARALPCRPTAAATARRHCRQAAMGGAWLWRVRSPSGLVAVVVPTEG